MGAKKCHNNVHYHKINCSKKKNETLLLDDLFHYRAFQETGPQQFVYQVRSDTGNTGIMTDPLQNSNNNKIYAFFYDVFLSVAGNGILSSVL